MSKCAGTQRQTVFIVWKCAKRNQIVQVVCVVGNGTKGSILRLTSSPKSHIPRRADGLLRSHGPALFVCALSAYSS